MSNRAVREAPQAEATPVETEQHRAYLVDQNTGLVVWRAQPPHYQPTAAAAHDYGFGIASKVYGLSWHTVKTEGRAVGPWKDDG